MEANDSLRYYFMKLAMLLLILGELMKTLLTFVAVFFAVSANAAPTDIVMCGIKLDPTVPYSLSIAEKGVPFEAALALARASNGVSAVHTCTYSNGQVLVQVMDTGLAYALIF